MERKPPKDTPGNKGPGNKGRRERLETAIRYLTELATKHGVNLK